MLVLILIALLGLKVYGVDVPAHSFWFAFFIEFVLRAVKVLAELLVPNPNR